MKNIDVFIIWPQIKLTTTTLNYCLGNSCSEKAQYITETAKYWFSKILHWQTHTQTDTYSNRKKPPDIRCLEIKATKGRDYYIFKWENMNIIKRQQEEFVYIKKQSTVRTKGSLLSLLPFSRTCKRDRDHFSKEVI